MFGKNLIKNKKGSLIDLIFIAVGMTFFAMVILIGLKVATDFETEFDANPMSTSEARNAVESTRVKFTNTIDNSFLILIVMMSMGVLILAALVRVHPIFIPIYFIGWILTIFLAGIFSNIYQAMADDANLSAIASQLTFIDGIMTTLPLVIGIVGIMLMVVMYKLWSVDQ